jgi:hypothetical protein
VCAPSLVILESVAIAERLADRPARPCAQIAERMRGCRPHVESHRGRLHVVLGDVALPMREGP